VSSWRLLLSLALAATLLAAVLAPPQAGEEIAAPAERATRSPSATATGNAAPAIEVLAIRSRGIDHETAPPFPNASAPRKPKRMEAPAALAVPKVEVVPPQPPALPFRVLGRYVDRGEESVFLQHNEQNIVARAGDTLPGDYRLESLADGVVTVIYLPLGVRQTVEPGRTE